MKKNIVCFFVLIVSNLLNAQTLSTDIAFEERVYNFGIINEAKGKVSHTFVFQNKGKSAITISDVKSGCGCIGKVVANATVKPGDKGKVTISFDPAYKSGFFSKEVVVLSNEGKNYNRIWVEGTINPAEHPITDDYPYNFGDGLYLRLKVMAFGYMKPGETKEMELHYANNTNKEMVLNFTMKDNQQGLKFAGPGKIAAKARGIIKFSYTMPSSAVNDVSFSLYPSVNKKKLKETLDIKILNYNRLNKNSSF